eukprot:scaffold99995_cov36-Tisochrysis_lutea.AAC.4
MACNGMAHNRLPGSAVGSGCAHASETYSCHKRGDSSRNLAALAAQATPGGALAAEVEEEACLATSAARKSLHSSGDLGIGSSSRAEERLMLPPRCASRGKPALSTSSASPSIIARGAPILPLGPAPAVGLEAGRWRRGRGGERGRPPALGS